MSARTSATVKPAGLTRHTASSFPPSLRVHEREAPGREARPCAVRVRSVSPRQLLLRQQANAATQLPRERGGVATGEARPW